MKLVLALALLGACGGSSKSSTTTPGGDSSTTSDASSTSSSPGSATTTTTSTTTTTGTMTPAAANAKKPLYSCFSYSQRGSTAKRSACMRTEECGPYLEQARQVGGIVADGGCASVETLWCFHQAATKTDPQGLDVCQPTADTCKSERQLLVKNGSSVDTDCAQR
ncbi:MAG TPA: hypothetical protein VL326_17350 [Kofleriaceae bacterium]|nr:hypothetical protein [Kofleriaceae bacterium]